MRILTVVFKRLMDVFFSLFGLIVFCLPLIVVIILIWRHDFRSPFYISARVGKNEKPFKIV